MSSSSSEQTRRYTFSRDKWPDRKTVDIGRNGITVSADAFGGIYQLTAPTCNEKYGLMVAAPWSQFDQAQRTNQQYVRRFRKVMEKMLEEHRHGLGLIFETLSGPVTIRHVRDSLGSQVQFDYCAEDLDLVVRTVLKVNGNGTILQASKVTNIGNASRSLPVFLNLRCAVSRAGYGQLTDRGEVPMPDPTNTIHVARDERNGACLVAIGNKSLEGRVTAYISFYNATTQENIEISPYLLPSSGPVQGNPSKTRHKAETQLVAISSGETLKFATLFRPEKIQSNDVASPFAYFLGLEATDANELTPDSIFAHDDTASDLQALIQRHSHEVQLNHKESEMIESIILWANVNYIIGCCAIPIQGREGNSCCLIADHFALPLGWPRDNYWQSRLLRQLDKGFRPTKIERLLPETPDKAYHYSYQIKRILAGHLWWLFRVATTEVPFASGIQYYWRRSYLINGQPKDGTVFQLDTQCYPFLELCEYWEAYGHNPGAKETVQCILRTETFKNVLMNLLSRRDSRTSLLASDETPADDDLGDYRFHLSSNILLWHTLMKLRELLEYPHFKPTAEVSLSTLDKPGDVLKEWASLVRRSILKYFEATPDFHYTSTGRSPLILAYSYDPSKDPNDPDRHRLYHDGNDLPTLYANEWGLFRNHDGEVGNEVELAEIWKNTMEWAFTPNPCNASRPGFNTGYQGNGTEPFHGLGSDHSPGPWTLGFFQEWKYAQMVGDKRRELRAWDKIAGSTQWDGTFSEVVSIHDGKCTSKTWFSWPGAMIAENLIDAVVSKIETARVK